LHHDPARQTQRKGASLTDIAAPAPPVLTGAEMTELFAVPPAREMFGPGSGFPALAFDLRGLDLVHSAALAHLPCPVIGVGNGPLAPICDVVVPDEAAAARLTKRAAAVPLAAMVLVQHLRASADLPIFSALTAESMAYAAIQTGPEFQAWQARRPTLAMLTENGPPLLVERRGDTLQLTMNRPRSRNAIDVAMRDALCEALDLAAIDASVKRVELTGAGRCFSTGGEVREFGQAADPATAHWVRSLRLPATRAAAIADRLEVRIEGAAIGAGIEFAAFAGRVVAGPGAWFQLPELDYGLIPGAGGTVSIPRRIGRQRATEIMLSGRRVRAEEALSIGLIDAIKG
jgi:hypothetical protein